MLRNQNEIERQPRFGVDPEKIEEFGVDLANSSCNVFLSPEEHIALKIIAIINISIGGIKVVVTHSEEIHGIGQKLELLFPAKDREYRLPGKLAWSENMATGQHWFGIELRLSQDALQLFKDLTGQEIK